MLVDGSGAGGLSVCLHLLFVANGRAIPQGGVPPGGIVKAFDEAEAGHACLDLRDEPAPFQQFAFEGGKEALAQGVVIGIADGSHGRPDAGLPAALAEGQGRILRPLVRVVNDAARPTLADGHVERIKDELGAQVVGGGPADDPAAPDIEHHGEVEEAGPP